MSETNGTVQRTPPASCSWEANLAALRPVNPALAERLAALGAGAADAPEPWQRQIARDGAASFCKPAVGDRPTQWLGGTAVPRAAAEAVIGGMQLPAAGTFCFDGGGAGYALDLLIRRLGRRRCVAATCTDAESLGLWLHLHDWAAHLADGRLLLFAGEDRWEQMSWFFGEHPGFEAPSAVASWPTVQAPGRAEARRQCRAINAQTARRRGKLIESLKTRLHARPPANRDLSVLAAEPPAAAIVLAAGGLSRPSRRWSRLLAEACREDGYDVRVVEMDAPASATGVPLGEAVAEADPAAVMLVDRLRPEAGPLLPADVPVLSWLIGPQLADADAKGILARLGEPGPKGGDRLVSSHAPLLMALREAGLTARRGLYCPPPADPALLAEPLDAERDGVAIIGDVTVPDPAVFGITLPSLRALWEALCEEIARRWIPYSDDQFPTFLERTQRRAGIRLEADSPTTAKFTHMLRRIAADNQLLIGAATDLAGRNVPLRLYGAGWSQIESLAAHVRGAADQAGCREAVTRSAALVHLSTRTNATDLVADAAAAGCAVILKPLPSDPSNHGASALLHIGTECQIIQEVPGLLRTIERLTRDPAARRKQTAAARGAIERAGLMTHRLAALRRFLADRPA